MFVSQCWLKSVTNIELVEDCYKSENGEWINYVGGIYLVPLEFKMIVATASAVIPGTSEECSLLCEIRHIELVIISFNTAKRLDMTLPSGQVV